MLQTARRKKIHIGPEDHGRRMSLDDFDHAIGLEGWRYELSGSIIEVSDIPCVDHGMQVWELMTQLIAYKLKRDHPIKHIAAAGEAKVPIAPTDSERHPDLTIYLSKAPNNDEPWSMWVPEIVIEVASEPTRVSDYEVKPGEYLKFGVKEYWIIDVAKKQMVVHQRWRGQWKKVIIKPPKKYTTRWLPGFSLDLKRVFAAASKAKSGK